MADIDQKTVDKLEHNIARNPGNRSAYEQLVHYFNQHKQWRRAVECYQRYLTLQPKDPEGHFNLAYQLKLAQDYEQSIEHYLQAYRLGISQPEEVFLNVALIYSDFLRDNASARKYLEKSLNLNSEYVSALYNLANLEEDLGNRQQANTLFKKILAISPNAIDCHSRIVQLRDYHNDNDSYDERDEHISMLKKFCLAAPNRNTIQSHISARFALGKAFNDLQQFEQAWDWYQQANTLNRYILPPYESEKVESAFSQIKQHFNPEYFEQQSLANPQQPIFICGMFRSGSTLVEQLLAGHSSITAGGEREFLPRQIKGLMPNFPFGLEGVDAKQLQSLSEAYLQDLQDAFPDASLVTDKRPDNFVYVGLIMAMFPNAKVIFTRRHPLDNCLSNYFLQLGPGYNYAADIQHCLHYYQQQQALIEHWCTLFPDNVYVFDYEQLIESPVTEVTDLLEFLGLKFEPSCLDFHTLKNTVKTASVWQVRKPLYRSSSGRWKNYQPWLNEVLGHGELARLAHR
ncbi:tetratricopeptide repeat protein [Thalassotalea litorea]|uniref:Tetratricopeptide repeat protein n=1 Tax=Thalassotalea litorea TaxID=2020715 RepID=A0A5R9ISF4_9GAMM|nr:sulfotransferase [Thalassotalea litorea]TLU64858.1 tetratricopeptide repeat protein [Thalassotalea litorea]